MGGQVRCKRYGCQKMFDPDGPEQPCQYHKSAPIFHETAKWWSCCPDRKAYDWEEFMKIPGCQKGCCSTNPEEQQGKKRVLGGCDVRGDSAPVRLDADAPKDARQKIAEMVNDMVALGVERKLVEGVWAKLANEYGDDQEKV